MPSKPSGDIRTTRKQPDGSLRHTTEIIGDRGVSSSFGSRHPTSRSCLACGSMRRMPKTVTSDRVSGTIPWTKATHPMYEDIKVPPPRLGAAKIFESQPDHLKESINRERFFWRWDTPDKYQSNIRAYFRMITGIDIVIGRVRAALEGTGPR